MQFKNFFHQPVEGFHQHNQGRTEAQLNAFETKIGFALPKTYRQLMQLQNGGSVRYGKIPGVDQFGFHSGFMAIRLDLDYYIYQYHDYILASHSHEDLLEARQTLAPFYPERLILVSGLDGHGAICLDYGYRTEAILETPAVVVIDDDAYIEDDSADKSFLSFCEIARFESFDVFLENLEVDVENQLEHFVGIVSNVDFETTVQAIASHLGIELESHVHQDQNADYIPQAFYVGHLPLYLDDETLKVHAEQNNSEFAELLAWTEEEGRTRRIYSVFSRNQHQAGTYLYQDNPEVNVVIEVRKTWFALQKPLEGLMTQLRQIPQINEVLLLE